MSEVKLPNGKDSPAADDSAAKDVLFDSKDIGKKEKTEYFVKVEGAEARKKAAIRRIKEQKADAAREEKAQLAAKEKEAKREVRVKKQAARKAKRKAFVKKYKILFIILAILLVGALIAVAVYFILNPPLTEAEKESMATMELQEEVDTEFEKKAEEILEGETGSYDEVVAWTKEEIEKIDDNARKFQLYSQLVHLAMENSSTLDDSFVFLKEMEKLAASDEEFVSLYTQYSLAYFEKGDMTKYEEYSNKSNEYRKKTGRLLDGAV